MKKILFKEILAVGFFAVFVTLAGCAAAASSSTQNTKEPPAWVQATAAAAWLARNNFAVATGNGKLWVFGGATGNLTYANDVWSSPDGVTWNEATASANWVARQGLAAVFFNGKLWISGGFNPYLNINYMVDLWSSTDGVTWNSQGQFSAVTNDGRNRHGMLVFNNKLWVLGGYAGSGSRNDVFSSDTDGLNWTQATASANWGKRFSFGAVVFNGKMWVMGGKLDNHKIYNDVWSSTDGVTWTEATASANWEPRRDFALVVYKGKMWIFGGYADTLFNSQPRNDVWSSADGITWTREIATSGWTKRGNFCGTTFGGKIWMLGGNGSGGNVNDVWSLTTE